MKNFLTNKIVQVSIAAIIIGIVVYTFQNNSNVANENIVKDEVTSRENNTTNITVETTTSDATKNNDSETINVANESTIILKDEPESDKKSLNYN